jgi:pyrroloquinoline quinone (PQQ) biosynthesis protein C/quercetin dioxygenase-like cupin family protein
VVAISLSRAVEDQLAALRRRQDEHPLWSSRLLTGFTEGAFSRDDLQYVFAQYHHYSKNFSRFIAAVMANCDNDLFRAQISENLWDEGGGCQPERRHAEIFRSFLRRSLGIEQPDAIKHAPYARHFVREYLEFCLRADPTSSAAFLSLGTEDIVARLYEIMLVGLRKVGIPDGELEFFHIHISCDDDHARTLENVMLSYAGDPSWFDACQAAMTRALDLRTEFFDGIFDAIQHRRLASIVARLHGHRSLLAGLPDAAIHHRLDTATEPLYANQVDKLNVEFTVERLPLSAEVLDPRIVRIPPGKFNEKHKHAHETLIHILEGTGQVLVDDRTLAVRPGDSVLVPRWALHQTQNLGASELRFLAVTDFKLSQRAYLGAATDYRLHADADALRR